MTKKTIKQAEYGDEIVHKSEGYLRYRYWFLGVHPNSNDKICYAYKTPGGVNHTTSMNPNEFFNTFKLKPKERWVLVHEKSNKNVNADTRGPFSSMGEAIGWAEMMLDPSKWEAVKLED